MISSDVFIEIRTQLETLLDEINLLLSKEESKVNITYLKRMQTQITVYFRKINRIISNRVEVDENEKAEMAALKFDALRFINKLSDFKFDFHYEGAIIINNKDMMDILRVGDVGDVIVSCIGIKYAYESILPINWIGQHAASYQSLKPAKVENDGRWSLWRLEA